MTVLLEYQSIKTFFVKGYLPIWSEELFVIQKVKTTITCKFSDLKGIETFVTLKKL